MAHQTPVSPVHKNVNNATAQTPQTALHVLKITLTDIQIQMNVSNPVHNSS